MKKNSTGSARSIEQLAAKLAREDRPLTTTERARLTGDLAASLGWPRERVMSDALLRLHAALYEKGKFEPLTPDEQPMSVYRKKARALLKRVA